MRCAASVKKGLGADLRCVLNEGPLVDCGAANALDEID